MEPWNVGLSRKQWRCGDVGVANSVCVQGHGFDDFGAVQLAVMYHNPDISTAELFTHSLAVFDIDCVVLDFA